MIDVHSCPRCGMKATGIERPGHRVMSVHPIGRVFKRVVSAATGEEFLERLDLSRHGRAFWVDHHELCQAGGELEWPSDVAIKIGLGEIDAGQPPAPGRVVELREDDRLPAVLAAGDEEGAPGWVRFLRREHARLKRELADLEHLAGYLGELEREPGRALSRYFATANRWHREERKRRGQENEL